MLSSSHGLSSQFLTTQDPRTPKLTHFLESTLQWGKTLNLLLSCFKPAGSITNGTLPEKSQTLFHYTLHDACPPGRTFVPSHLRGKLIIWVHTALVSGHAGVQRTMELLSEKYWWPRMRNDMQKFVTFCSSSAKAKVPHLFPRGQLMSQLYHNAHGRTSPLISSLISQNLQVRPPY